jgi:hypothetical protein
MTFECLRSCPSPNAEHLKSADLHEYNDVEETFSPSSSIDHFQGAGMTPGLPLSMMYVSTALAVVVPMLRAL